MSSLTTTAHSRLLNARQAMLAARDLIEGTANWRTWYVLGISEVRHRYRRSVLGPFWITISLGIQALIMGFLLSFLFKVEMSRFLPFLCIGLVTWAFISSSVIEGANGFISQSSLILQVKRPLWTFVMLVLWRNALIYLHTIVVFVVAALAYGLLPTEKYLLIPFGLALLVLNAGWMALIAGLLSARFRDVPLLIQNAMNVLVWLTPIYYQRAQLGEHASMIIALNPLTHVVEVARAPFLNEVPPASTWLIAVAVAVVGWAVAFALLVRTRARVPFWL
jgi:ABC-type polysaccharide/polyol phosphate export permease